MAKSPKIIVRGPNWIGDQIMALDFYHALRRGIPGAEIFLLVDSIVAGLGLVGAWDQVWKLEAKDWKFPPSLDLISRIQSEKFDVAISLPHSFSASSIFFAAGVPCRVGFSGDWNRWMLTRAVRWQGRTVGRHKSSLYLDLLRLVPGWDSQTIYPAEIHQCEQNARENVIVVAPGASIPLREWPYFPELVAALRARHPEFTIRVVGSSNEAKWSGFIRRLADSRVEDWIGRTSLGDLKQLCEKSKLVVANDSGVAHVAATLSGAPTLVLFGPGDPTYVAPKGRVAMARHDISCSPCESSNCRAPLGYQRCLRDFSVDDVIAQAETLL